MTDSISPEPWVTAHSSGEAPASGFLPHLVAPKDAAQAKLPEGPPQPAPAAAQPISKPVQFLPPIDLKARSHQEAPRLVGSCSQPRPGSALWLPLIISLSLRPLVLLPH